MVHHIESKPTLVKPMKTKEGSWVDVRDVRMVGCHLVCPIRSAHWGRGVSGCIVVYGGSANVYFLMSLWG